MSEFKLLRRILSKYSSPITISYPSTGKKYSQVPEGLRGIPERDKDKCIGCKACYFICSGRATNVFDEGNKRIIDIFLFRCTFCGHCQELCPEEAIKLTQNFEVAFFGESSQNHISTELELLTCKRCGKPYATKKMLERTYERLVERIDPLVRDVVSNDYEKAMHYCTDCKRALSIALDTHTKKYVWLEVK